MIEFFMDPNLFLEEVLKIVAEKKCSHMDAVMDVCDIHNIEPESAGALIKNIEPLKRAIRVDATKLHFFKKTGNSLPL